jgi:hypothetical protein
MRPRHRHEAVAEVLPADDPGVMVTDLGRRDEAHAFDHVRQPQGVAHSQRSLRDILATKTGRARDVGEGRKERRQEAVQRRHASRERAGPDVPTAAKARPEKLTSQLRDRRRRDPAHQRLLNALGWHHDRGHMLRCLADPRSDPTNHRAARAAPRGDRPHRLAMLED